MTVTVIVKHELKPIYFTSNYVCMYVGDVWFCFVRFYGISTLVGYLKPNPLYAVFSHNKYAYIHIYMFMQDTYWRNE